MYDSKIRTLQRKIVRVCYLKIVLINTDVNYATVISIQGKELLKFINW